VGLTEPQIQRYARHVLLPDVGGVGQARLLAAAVRVELDADFAGAVAAATYLAAAGVGTIVLAGDAARAVTAQDVVGGVALGEDDLGSPVGDALAARLEAINPDVRVTCDDPSTGLRTGVDGAHALPALSLPGVDASTVADALVRGGAAAARVIHRIATSS
jgi:molybdopterin/thiamine biosynthesis adenylyltransferase